MFKGRVSDFLKPMLIFEITKTNTLLPQNGLAPILIDPPHIYVACENISRFSNDITWNNMSQETFFPQTCCCLRFHRGLIYRED